MNLNKQFAEDGYVIVPDLIPHSKVDRLTAALERFKRGHRPYWSESIHKWILPPLDDHGFMTESMENFTRLWFSKGMKDAGYDIILGSEINGVLRQLKPGQSEFVHWLNHFFDKSTGSNDHIDNWYLDTDPAGELVGAWVALEDIHPDSGPFRLFPKTHLDPAMKELWPMEHNAFVKHCAGLAKNLQPQPVIIKKGTVVFFHPFLLHGATDQVDPQYSRKSVTAHYIPFGTLRKEREPTTESNEERLQREMKQARKINGRPIAVSHTWHDELVFNTTGIARFAKSLIFGQTPIVMDMKRRSLADS